MYVGVDGCKGGWFAVALREKGKPEGKPFKTITELWSAYKNASLILIDIPIGLREGGPEERERKERKCDKEARAKLGQPRGSSVFPAPCRQALDEEDYGSACSINERMTGRKLSKQSFCIMSKIRDVDNFLRANNSARQRIRETHPEICFWALNGGSPMTGKKRSREGKEERRCVLNRVRGGTAALMDDAKSERRGKGVSEDDVLDALAAATTAKLAYPDGFQTLPGRPEKDSQHLPMQIVYCLRRGRGKRG